MIINFSAADLLPRDLEPLEDAWELAGAGVDRALDPEAHTFKLVCLTFESEKVFLNRTDEE